MQWEVGREKERERERERKRERERERKANMRGDGWTVLTVSRQ